MLIDINDDFIAMMKLRFPEEDMTQVINDSLFVIRDKTVEDIREDLRRSGVGSLILEGIGQDWIGAIKCVREHTGLGLKEAKDITDEVKGGKPRTFAPREMCHKYQSDVRYTLADFARALTERGCRIKYACDPRDIAQVRMKYGVYAPEILQGMFE